MKKWRSLISNDAIGVMSVNLGPLLLLQDKATDNWFRYFLMIIGALFAIVRLLIYAERKKTLVIENDSKAILNERYRIENINFARRERIKSSLLKVAFTACKGQLSTLSESKSFTGTADGIDTALMFELMRILAEGDAESTTNKIAERAKKAEKRDRRKNAKNR